MIGVFDSGVGGLTVLKAMRDVYPSIDVVYFGDTKNAPYGKKSGAELSALTVAGIRFLLDHGATTLVSACNSVSASLAVSLYDVLSIKSTQLIEMVGPTVSAFKGSSERVALCATTATIESGMYQNAFLGCTHYPLVMESFRHAVGTAVSIFDPAEAVAERVQNDLWPREMGYGTTRFFISKESAQFRALAEKLFAGQEFTVEVV
ncbi:hypothetical protein K8R03_03675 [Candidatus Kaiserbacteria bacterium]|nr:hypothetical protein [Candidatus Kaiserbacteria bacterium]